MKKAEREYCCELLKIVSTSKNPRQVQHALDLLKKEGNLEDFVEENGANMLHYSAAKGNLVTIRCLLDRGFNINAPTNYGHTPLMLAVMKQKDDAALLLIEKNAKIDFYNSRGKSIFEYWRGFPGIILRSPVPRAMMLKLVEGCKTIEEKVKKLHNARCPLCLVAQFESHEMIDYYLKIEENSIREERTIRGITALHAVVFNHDLQSVKVLLEKGSNVNVQDAFGGTPLLYLRERQNGRDEHLAILKVLLEQGATLQEPLSEDYGMPIQSVFRCSKEAVRLVVEKGIDFHARDEQLRTPLHYIAENQNPDVMEVLKDQNMSVDALDECNTSALYYAAKLAHISSVRFLLSLGATVDTIDFWNQTPLAGSVKRSNPDFECAELLLQHGANAQKLCIFEAVEICKSFDQILPVLLHLATLKVSGRVIENEVMEKIRSRDQFLKPFMEYMSLLEEWRTFKPCNNLSLLELYTTDVQQLSIYLRNSELALWAEDWNTTNNQVSYLHRRLSQRFVEAFRLLQFKNQTTNSLSTLMGLNYNAYGLIIDLILGYLSEIDWQQLVRVLNDTI